MSHWEVVSSGKMTPIGIASNVIIGGRIRSVHRDIHRSAPRDHPMLAGYSGSISMETCVTDRDPNIVHSSLSRLITRDDITVDVQIYRLEHDPQWALEVINENRTSTTWDDLFDSDDEAFAAFEKVVAEEGIETFLDNANVIPFPKR